MHPFHLHDHVRPREGDPTGPLSIVTKIDEDKVSIGDGVEPSTTLHATDVTLVARPEEWTRSHLAIHELLETWAVFRRSGWHGSREDREAAALNMKLLATQALDYAAELEAWDGIPIGTGVCANITRSVA